MIVKEIYDGGGQNKTIVHSPLFVRIPFWPITLIITGLFCNPFHYTIDVVVAVVGGFCLLT